MADFLRAMAIASARRTRRARASIPDAELRARAVDTDPPAPLRLSDSGFDVIAEVKRRTPGRHKPLVAGPQTPELAARLATAYAEAGAVAVSVLTEPFAFAGDLDDLARASKALNAIDAAVPAMRKDFLVDPYQLLEARAAGAGGALLIADLLESDAIDPMLAAAEANGLWLLVEAFADERLMDAVDIAHRAQAAGLTALVGVNTRNLRTLDVDADRLQRLAGSLPTDVPAVAESGLRDAEDAEAASRFGYRLALVGTALVTAGDPGARLAEMIRAGRVARGAT